MIAAYLLPGWAMSTQVWQPLQQRLTFETKALDLPGFGARTNETCPNQLSDLAADLMYRIPEPALLIGWSLGGMTALRAALDFPERVAGLIVLCGTPKFVQSEDWPWGTNLDFFSGFCDMLEQDYQRGLRRFLLLQAGARDEARQITRDLDLLTADTPAPSAASLQAGLEVLAKADLCDEVPALSVPSLFISGKLDRICHPQASQWLAQNSGGELACLRSGHAPLLSHTSEVADLLNHFAAGLRT